MKHRLLSIISIACVATLGLSCTGVFASIKSIQYVKRWCDVSLGTEQEGSCDTVTVSMSRFHKKDLASKVYRCRLVVKCQLGKQKAAVDADKTWLISTNLDMAGHYSFDPSFLVSFDSKRGSLLQQTGSFPSGTTGLTVTKWVNNI